MPAVSFVPSAPTKQPVKVSSPNSTTATDDSSTTSFDDVLNSARSGNSAGASDSTSETSSADATKPAGKPEKSAKGKQPAASSVKGKSKNATSHPDAQPAQDADEDQTVQQATVATEEPANATEPTTTAGKGKPSHAAAQNGQAASNQTTTALSLPPAQRTQNDDKASNDSASEDATDQPSKGLAAVQSASAGAEDDATGSDDAQVSQSQSADSAAAATAANQSTAATKSATAKNVKSVKPVKAVDTNEDEAAANQPAQITNEVELAEGDASEATAVATGAKASDGSSSSAQTQIAHSTQSFSDMLASAEGQTAPPAKGEASVAHASTTSSANQAPEAQFADANHGQIVSNVKAQLLPNGGTMQMQLNPGELGAMSVSVHMRDGVMTATFATANDQAARLLTHSLGQLKTALEAGGVSVGKLHVEQAPKSFQSNAGNGDQDSGKGSASDQSAQQQEQQRKEMIKRMWRRLNRGSDPLDMVA